MKLYCLDSYDYCALKACVVAAGVGVDVVLERVSNAEEMTALHSEAKSLLLETPQGMRATQVGMMEYLVKLGGDNTPMGKTIADSAQIQNAIDKCWSDFGKFPHAVEVKDTPACFACA
jgi:hypothetical protein